MGADAPGPSGVLIKSGHAGATIDPEIRALRKTRFQVVVRDTMKRYDAAMAIAEAVSDALDISLETRVPDGILVKHCRPLTEPIPFPASDGNNIELVVNFTMTYVVY